MKRLAVLIVVALAASCGESLTVEQLIIAEIREMEARLEEGERLQFMGHIAEDFRGQGGQMNRDQLRAYVVLQFRRYENLGAQLFPIEVIEISDREARADFRALVTGGAGWLPDDGQIYKFVTHWRLEGDDWLLIAADWEAASLND